jgi:hypothetical protein
MFRKAKLSTRRLMVVVAASAVVLAGVRHDEQPGWHVGIGYGLRVGVCRNDARGQPSGSYGKPLGWTYQTGVWDSPGPRRANGTVRLGVWVRTSGTVDRWVACAVILDRKWIFF